MHIRERTEQLEESVLSPFACLSTKSKGREADEEACTVRTVFQRDRDRILHSKAFRRLKYKTQVFLLPEGDHYRTRLTHTLEVSQISRTIARGLRLNEDLTEAICMGHDVGHAPFAHAGEEVLNNIHPGGFRHAEQSVRVLQHLENGRGLNLTWEVLDGILHHNGKTDAATLEGRIVKIADRMAYLNHDVEDAIRAEVLSVEELPREAVGVLGKTKGERIHNMVLDMVVNSEGKPQIQQGAQVQEAMQELRQFMFRYVYLNPVAKKEEGKAKEMVAFVYRYFAEYPERLKEFGVKWDEAVDDLLEVVKDYVAGMTDRFIVSLYRELTIPKPWKIDV